MSPSTGHEVFVFQNVVLLYKVLAALCYYSDTCRCPSRRSSDHDCAYSGAERSPTEVPMMMMMQLLPVRISEDLSTPGALAYTDQSATPEYQSYVHYDLQFSLSD